MVAAVKTKLDAAVAAGKLSSTDGQAATGRISSADAKAELAEDLRQAR